MASVYLGDAPAAATEPRDLRPLRSFWHPVAAESEIGTEPYGVTLLGELVVVFRDEDGVIHAFQDLCPHRGAQLSKGRVVGGRLMCPYHGFQYDGEGKCRYIPSQPRDHQRIPARLKLAAYHTEVRYGLVWVAMEDPVSPIPEFPEYDDTGFHHFIGFDRTWKTSAARFIENAMDISHFPWVHAGSLGDPDHPELPPFEVRDAPHGLWYEYDWELPASGGHLGAQVHYEYFIDVPFTIRIRILGEEGISVIYSPTLPITDDKCRMWVLFARNHSFDRPDSDWADFSGHVWDEDQAVVETQRPERLPVDLTKEVHLRAADAPGISYRDKLAELGLEYA
jgi:phenylpropionate dioxygenase-like ring-hydroxylating dioxygenase large terminal subunit